MSLLYYQMCFLDHLFYGSWEKRGRRRVETSRKRKCNIGIEGAVVVSLLFIANPSFADETCSNFSAAESVPGIEPHMPNTPIFTIMTHQRDRSRPQYNKDEIYSKFKPFCRQEDCVKFIQTLPASHMSAMDFTFTCESGQVKP